MADIDIERKGTNPLPWILGLLLLALVAWGLWSLLRGRDDGDARAVVADTVADTLAGVQTVPPVAGGPAAGGDVVESFQQTCTSPGDEMARDHRFIADCLRRLATAVDTVLQQPQARGVDARGELEEVRRRAQALEQSPPDATDHSALASGGFTSAAALLERVQREALPGGGAVTAELRSAATALQPARPLLEQTDAVRRFFERAGAVLNDVMMAPAAT